MPALPSAFVEIMGQDVPQSAVTKGLLWWAYTPDGDVSPQYLKPGVASDMTSPTPFESTGRRGPTRGAPRRAAAYGEDWSSSFEYVLDTDFNDVLLATAPEAVSDQRAEPPGAKPPHR